MGGVNKGLITVGNRTIISRIYQRLSSHFNETLVIGDSAVDYGLHGVKVYSDIIQNAGPLGGIHSALVNSANYYVFIVSCDMPFVDAKIAGSIISMLKGDQKEVIIPRVDDFIEPLFAIYSKSLIGKIEELIRPGGGRPITDLIKVSNTQYLILKNSKLVQKCFTNLNTPEDLNNLPNSGANNRLR